MINKASTTIIAIALVLFLLWLGARALIKRISPRPEDLGIQNGQLRPCPDMPNCVCSQSSDPRHMIEPLTYSDTLEQARGRLVDVITAMPNASVITATDDYIHAEFVTPGFGYTDDVEFLFLDTSKTIELRSGARVPYYDFQVNRKRIEAIRQAFGRSSGHG